MTYYVKVKMRYVYLFKYLIVTNRLLTKEEIHDIAVLYSGYHTCAFFIIPDAYDECEVSVHDKYIRIGDNYHSLDKYGAFGGVYPDVSALTDISRHEYALELGEEDIESTHDDDLCCKSGMNIYRAEVLESTISLTICTRDNAYITLNIPYHTSPSNTLGVSWTRSSLRLIFSSGNAFSTNVRRLKGKKLSLLMSELYNITTDCPADAMKLGKIGADMFIITPDGLHIQYATWGKGKTFIPGVLDMSITSDIYRKRCRHIKSAMG